MWLWAAPPNADDSRDEGVEYEEQDGLASPAGDANGDGASDDTADGEEQDPNGSPSGSALGQLDGRVGIEGSRDPLAAARVIVGDETIEVDSQGRFMVQLAPGTYSVLIRAEGYIDRRTTIEIKLGERATVDLAMSRDLDRPYRTVVEDRREVAVSRTTLRNEEIHALPGSGGDPFRVVQSLPGVATVAGFLPYVVVRGAAPGNTSYFLDGVRVPLLFHVAAGPSVIHPYFIDAVDFYPAGAPVRLGRFASGAIEGRTRAARSDRIHGEFDIRLTDAGGLLEFPLSRPKLAGCTEKKRARCPKGAARGSLTFAGRYSYTGLLLSLIPALNLRLQFWDFQTRLDHDITSRLRYRAFAYGAYDLLGPKSAPAAEPGAEEPENARPDPLLRFEFYRLDQRLYRRIDRGEIMGALALGFDRSGATTASTKVYRIVPRVTIRKELRPGLEAGVGLDQEVQLFRADLGEQTSVEDIAAFLSDRTVFATGLWADLRLSRGPFELRPGIRGDVYLQRGRSAIIPGARSFTHAFGLDPRLVARERLSGRWVLRQSIGVYHQPPDAPFPVPGVESIGFERGLQRNVQGSMGYEWSLPGGKLELTQDIYLGRLSNLLDYDLAEALSGTPQELEDVILSTNGWTYGLETMLRLVPTLRVYGWASYTLSRSVRSYALGGTAPSAWDQSHILNIALGYRLGKKWRMGGRLHFHTGRPYTALYPGQDPVDALSMQRNRARLPSYFQFDVRIERIWLRKKSEISLYLDVLNSTLSTEILSCAGAENSLSVDQFAPGSLPGCRNPQGIPFILPTIGVRGVF